MWWSYQDSDEEVQERSAPESHAASQARKTRQFSTSDTSDSRPRFLLFSLYKFVFFLSLYRRKPSVLCRPSDSEIGGLTDSSDKTISSNQRMYADENLFADEAMKIPW